MRKNSRVGYLKEIPINFQTFGKFFDIKTEEEFDERYDETNNYYTGFIKVRNFNFSILTDQKSSLVS